MLQDLFYCHEIHFTAASFVLLPQILFYRCEFYFHRRDFDLRKPSGTIVNIVSTP